MFRRRQVITHGRLAREELTESYEHLRMAAAHAASGAAGAMAPRVDAARKAVRPGLHKARGKAHDSADTIVRAARRSKAKVQKKETGMTGRRWSMIIGGLLAAGAAVGAASALMKRRKAQHTWDEYGSTRSTGESIAETAKSTMDAGIAKVSSMADSAKDRTADLIGSSSTPSTHSGQATPADLAAGQSRDVKQQRDDLYGKTSPATTTTASTGSKNSRT